MHHVGGRHRAEESADVVRGVEEVRRLLRERGRAQAAWFVSALSRPLDLEQRLRGLGLVPYDDPPLEPECAAMAIVQPPLGTTDDSVVARAIESYEELVTTTRIVAEAAGMSEGDRTGMEERLDELGVGVAGHHNRSKRLRGGSGGFRLYGALRVPVGADVVLTFCDA